MSQWRVLSLDLDFSLQTTEATQAPLGSSSGTDHLDSDHFATAATVSDIGPFALLRIPYRQPSEIVVPVDKTCLGRALAWGLELTTPYQRTRLLISTLRRTVGYVPAESRAMAPQERCWVQTAPLMAVAAPQMGPSATESPRRHNSRSEASLLYCQQRRGRILCHHRTP